MNTKSEGKFESDYLKYCRIRGIACKKLILASEASWPDRTLLYKGKIMFMELKRKGEKPTHLQLYTLKALTDQGFYAVWSSDLDDAMFLTEQWRVAQ